MEKKEKLVEEDEQNDMMYFQCLLKYLENVAPEQKLSFREELLRLVKSFAFPVPEQKKNDNEGVPDWRLFPAPMHQLHTMKMEPGTYERGLENQRYGFFDPRYSTQPPASSEVNACGLQPRNHACMNITDQARGSGVVKPDPDFKPYMDRWPERRELRIQPRSQDYLNKTDQAYRSGDVNPEQDFVPFMETVRTPRLQPSNQNYMNNVDRACGSRDIKPDLDLIPHAEPLHPESYARRNRQLPPRVYPSQADAKMKAALAHKEHLTLPYRAGQSGSNQTQAARSQAIGTINDSDIKPDPDRVINHQNMGRDIETIDLSDDEDL